MNTFIICNAHYGNIHFTITREEIEALLAGKILASGIDDEYGVFISLKEE